MAKNLRSAEAERLLLTTPAERARIPALDFLRAKAHLALDEELHRRLLEPRVQLTSYGKDAERRELARGASLRIGPLRLHRCRTWRRAAARTCGSCSTTTASLRSSASRPWLPDLFQRVFRFRRSRQRVVS